MEKTNADFNSENTTSENNFQLVKQLRSDINNIFNEVDEKIKILNEIYNELVKTHHDKNYIIGLDSFHFQNNPMANHEYEVLIRIMQ